MWVVARADDVINVAGHRLSTAALEDVVLRHARVADAVVVGAPDRTKGDVPLCLYVMRPPQDGMLRSIKNRYIPSFNLEKYILSILSISRSLL